VQRFSAQRRILAKLRALARRRSQPVPEPEAGPVQLHVEENRDWAATDDRLLEGLGTGLREWQVGGAGDPVLVHGALDDEAALDPGADSGFEAAAAPANEPAEDSGGVIIRQLEEDNQDLRAALCRLIRISEQNHAAIRLLEEENEELSTLVHRLTIGQTKAVAHPDRTAETTRRLGPWRLPAWGTEWLRRWETRRCT